MNINKITNTNTGFKGKIRIHSSYNEFSPVINTENILKTESSFHRFSKLSESDKWVINTCFPKRKRFALIQNNTVTYLNDEKEIRTFEVLHEAKDKYVYNIDEIIKQAAEESDITGEIIDIRI
ncbi:MAG: hypothetical protein LUG16_00575, partial [Candidatus Gastranaerophilales bacterium]|nr:hypothetical protein [Candidatus Gastranaerophilales bacterium]